MSNETRRLTHKQWLDVKPPLFWIKVSIVNNWPAVVLEMVNKWLDQSVTGWWYKDNVYYVFEKMEDRATFKFWLLSGVFESEEYGDL